MFSTIHTTLYRALLIKNFPAIRIVIYSAINHEIVAIKF